MHAGFRIGAVIALLFGLAFAAPLAKAQSPQPFEPQIGQPGKDVIWVPTPDELITAMLRMGRVGPDDYLVDLGSGDGKIPIAAARDFAARAHGVEYNPDMIALSRHRAQEAGVAGRATFERGDIFAVDFSQATVVTLYLLPSLNLKLRPTLMAMRPGTRVISHAFDMGAWRPDDEVTAGGSMAYLWVVPAQAAGRWRLDLPGLGPTTISFEQTFQTLQGEARTRDGRAVALQNPRLRGAWLEFDLVEERGRAWRIAGSIDGAAFAGGARQGGGAPIPVSMTRLAAGVVAMP